MKANRIFTSNIFWIILFFLLAIMSITLIFIMRSSDAKEKTADIYSDNKLVRTVSLEKDDEFTIKNGKNYNIVRIRNGKISVCEADCKNQICVNQGEIDNSLFPIVCVPNGLVIRVDSNNQSDIDAAV